MDGLGWTSVASRLASLLALIKFSKVSGVTKLAKKLVTFTLLFSLCSLLHLTVSQFFTILHMSMSMLHPCYVYVYVYVYVLSMFHPCLCELFSKKSPQKIVFGLLLRTARCFFHATLFARFFFANCVLHCNWAAGKMRYHQSYSTHFMEH